MNCAEVLERLPLYQSGELDADRAAVLRAHLASCAACARELQQQTEFDTHVRQGILAEELDLEHWIHGSGNRSRAVAQRAAGSALQPQSRPRWF